MAKINFLILCDHVRAESGVAHIIAAGVDRVAVPAVPGSANLGLAVRVAFFEDEWGKPQTIRVVYKSDSGEKLAEFRGEVTPSAPKSDVPPGWPSYGLIAVNMGIPLPKYGSYLFELDHDGTALGSWPFYVLPTSAPDGSDSEE